MVHHIKCAEIWGGIRGDELDVETCGVRASLFSRACDGGKGGDIYYFSVCGSDLLTRIAVADVMGHGEKVSSTSQWLYDSLASNMNSSDGTQVLGELNHAAVEYGEEAMTTAVVAAFYRADRKFYASYAGHHEVLVNRKDESNWGAVESTRGEGMSGLPLGVDDDTTYVQSSVPLVAGDRVFVFTDGVVEAPSRNGELFGQDRLLNVLRNATGADIDAVRSHVLDGLLAHTKNELSHDDVTFMAVEILD